MDNCSNMDKKHGIPHGSSEYQMETTASIVSFKKLRHLVTRIYLSVEFEPVGSGELSLGVSKPPVGTT